MRLALFFFFLVLSVAAASSPRTLLSEVSTLTLYRGVMTAGRRHAPISQLECSGGEACHYYSLRPTVMQCRNMGSDGHEIQWRCEAELDASVKLGKIEVSCEGYDHRDDPYILAGSCGVKYELHLTETGRQRLEGMFTTVEDHSGSFSIFFVAVTLFFLVVCCCWVPINSGSHAYYPQPYPQPYYHQPSWYTRDYWWGHYNRPTAHISVSSPRPSATQPSTTRPSTGFGGTRNR